MFILVNIVVSALVAPDVLPPICSSVNDLYPNQFHSGVVIERLGVGVGVGGICTTETSLIWFFTVLRGGECEMVCVLLDFKQYFRNCVTALIIFPQCYLNRTTSYTKAE